MKRIHLSYHMNLGSQNFGRPDRQKFAILLITTPMGAALNITEDMGFEEPTHGTHAYAFQRSGE